MKVICLIGPPVHLNYLVNKISSEYEVVYVIREKTPVRNIHRKIAEKGFFTSLKIALSKLKESSRNKIDYNNILGSEWKSIGNSIPVLEVEDINDNKVINLLANIDFDAVVVQGTSIIQSKVFSIFPIAINLHWGLSPYYRGSYCTEWALLNSDPLNIGFTIHKLSTKIDGGEIISQGKPDLVEKDTVNSINMKLNKVGTKEVLKILNKIKNGNELTSHKQDLDKGFLYLTKHLPLSRKNKLKTYIHTHGLKDMLKKPTRKPKPIIKG